jgi:MoaA/NifB/PqqE/SkfB family radical SAM enzyme
MGAGHLKLDHFEALLDQNPNLAEVELSNYGEMFLNPRLPDLMRCAWERKVTLHANNGVNLNFASDAALEGLVRYRFSGMSCSIDGASPESYRQYRVKGDFERVIGHIRRINEYKRQYRSGFPLLRWQFIVFGHNEHEIAAARKLAGELGMTFVPKLSWDDGVSPIRNRELVQIQMRIPAITRREHYESTGRDYMRGICYQLWRAPVLNWDGRVTGCCRNFWGDFGGNAFTDGLEESVNSDGIRAARDMLMGRGPERTDVPCATCDLYDVIKKDKTWLTEEEIGAGDAEIIVSVVPEVKAPATHVDVFLAPGEQVDRRLLAQPPQALRFEAGRSFSVCFTVRKAGDYTIYALPKQLDPNFRVQYPPISPVTMPIRVPERPVAQEFRIEV